MHSSRRNLAWLAAVGLCAVGVGCAPVTLREGGAAGAKAERARKEAAALAVAGVNGGAAAQAKAVPETARHDWVMFGGRVVIDDRWRLHLGSAKDPAAPAHDLKPAPDPLRARLPVRPGSPILVYEKVTSAIPYPTEADAEEDALEQACVVVERRLAELDPPVRHRPSVAEVKAEFVRADSRSVHPPTAAEKEMLAKADLSTDLVFVEFDVEVTADQVRELRSRERLLPAVRVLGGLFAVALACFLFFRLDDWTKGTLTVWLALGAMALAAGGVTAAALV